MPSIGHLVAIAFVELLALILGVGSIFHIGGLCPGVATEALEAASLTSFTTVLPLHILHMIGSAIILIASFCSIHYLFSLNGEDPPDHGGDPPPDDGGGGGGGGGCPILSVYDGNQYISEGLLNIHASEDFIRWHRVHAMPESVGKRYLLRLTEHPQTISHIDQVRLFARLQDGRMIELPLTSAVHSAHGNVKQKLLISDDVRVDTLGAEHNNGVSEFIDLKFVAPPRLEIVECFFIIEGYNAISKV